MRSFRDIKRDYRFTEEDERRLAALRPLMEEHAEEIMNTLNSWFTGTKGASAMFTPEVLKNHIYKAQKLWFGELFSGTYDTRFYEKLGEIGAAHMRRRVDVHYLYRAANIIKNSCIGILSRQDEPVSEITTDIITVGKIVDMSLTVIVSTYIEEEMRLFSPVYRVRSALITFSEGFAQGTNFLLVIALIGLTIGVGWLFIRDAMNIFTGDAERGIISALGSMLLIWLMIELMNTEISHLKGGKFHISVFVGVALVTMIRETMIATLRHEEPASIYYLIAAILVIGFVYWIVTKTEHRPR